MSLQPERAESSTRGATLCALALCVMCACHESGGGGGSAAATPAATTTRLGDPIEGLTGMERAAFERGRVQFEKRFRALIEGGARGAGGGDASSAQAARLLPVQR